MSAPTIHSVTAPASAVVGVPFDVAVDATGAASRPVTLTATATDATGAATTQDAMVQVSDPVTVTLTTTDKNVDITSTAFGAFTVTAH